MKHITITMLLCSALLGACGQNGGANVGKGDISQNRTTAFKSFMPTFSEMGKVVKGDEPYDIEKFKEKAQQFSEEAQAPFEYFQSDPQGNGDALPEIWTNPEQFKTAKENFLQAVAKLNETAQAGNLEQIKVVYGETQSTCKACHDSFRRPK